MTQTQLEYFLKTCETHNISTTSDVMGVSRSVVSRALKDLEHEFGAILFLRSKDGVVLTEAGQSVYHLFSTIENGYWATIEGIKRLSHQKNEQQLILSTTPTNGLKSYRMIIQPFLAIHPDVAFHIDERSSDENLQLLSKGTIEGCFTPYLPSKISGIERIKLYNTRVVLAVRNDNPLSKKPEADIGDILDCSFGFLGTPLPTEYIISTCFSAFNRKPNVVIRTSSEELLRYLTETGVISAVLPSDFIEHWDHVVAVPLKFFPPLLCMEQHDTTQPNVLHIPCVHTLSNTINAIRSIFAMICSRNVSPQHRKPHIQCLEMDILRIV